MPQLTDDEAVLAADESRYQALYAQDLAALDAMLSDDYLHTHANGKTDDKTAFLNSIRAAKYRFVVAVRSNQRIRRFGTTVFLSGTTQTTIDVGGEIKVMDNVFLTVWTTHGAELRLVHWQATKIVPA
jgi:ketosteroid isomerase-like protein